MCALRLNLSVENRIASWIKVHMMTFIPCFKKNHLSIMPKVKLNCNIKLKNPNNIASISSDEGKL